MHARIYSYIIIYVFPYLHTFLEAKNIMYECAHAYIMCIHIQTHACLYTYIDTYIHTNLHVWLNT